MNQRSKLLLLLFIGLMIPPGMWLFILYYTQVFNLSELISIVLSLPMIGYIVFVTAGVMYFFNIQLRHIEAAVIAKKSSVAADKSLSNLPAQLLITQFLYHWALCCSFGTGLCY